MGPSRAHPGLLIRPYRREDAASTLAVFIDAITVTAAADYAPEQIAAWARPEQRDLTEWDRAMLGRNSLVAVADGAIAGFSDVSAGGHIDMMFVSPHHARRGVATALLARLEAEACAAGAVALSTDASLTARPFFERCGFVANAEQHPVIGGVRLTNFRMSKALPG